MSVKHVRNGMFLNPNRCHTGDVPDALVSGDAQQNYMHLRQWLQQNYVSSYRGRADRTINGAGANAFYIITSGPVPETGATTRKLAFRTSHWGQIAYGGAQVWTWDSPTGGTPAALDFSPLTQPPGQTAQAQTEFPAGDSRSFTLDYTPVELASNSGYVCSTLSVTNAMFASMDVWTLPPDAILDSETHGLENKNFAVGQTVRGYDSDGGTSLARIIHGTDDTDDENGILDNTRQCLLQECWPNGRYCVGSGALAYQNAFPASFTYKIRPRNLRNRTTGTNNCEIAMVISGDTGAKIRLTSMATSDTVSLTLGGPLTASFQQITTGLNISPDKDTIKVEAYVSTTVALNIHTLSLWEKPNGEEV